MIYFAQMQTMPYLIKIGFTQDDNLFIRTGALKSESKSEILLLMTLEGNRSKEMKFHSKFQDACMAGEWFFPSKRLLEFLSKNSAFDKLHLIKKNELHRLIDFKNAVVKDHHNLIEEIKNQNRNLKKEVDSLYVESKRLLSENIELESELKKKLKSEKI